MSESTTPSEETQTVSELPQTVDETIPTDQAPIADGTETTAVESSEQAPSPLAGDPQPTDPMDSPAESHSADEADTTVPSDEPAEPEQAPDKPAEPEQAPEEPAEPEQAPEEPAVPAPAAPATAAPKPGEFAGKAHAPSSASFGRVEEDGTVYVRTPEGEMEVGSYPGATPDEALAYFARKYDDVHAQADLLLQRVTQTDLAAREAGDSLKKLRELTTDLRAVGDLVALAAKVENIATAIEARRTVEAAERAEARQEATAAREKIVAEAEKIAGTDENKMQWKSSSARMRDLLEEWKTAQRSGPKLDREAEQVMWQRLSTARNSFDKLRRVHFAQLSSSQSEAKAAKQALIDEAERLAKSTEWSATAGAFKRLMDQWRNAGRASRSDDDALWARFKAAQDSFFQAKDSVVAAENEEYKANLVVKEELLKEAKALLPIKDLAATKTALRGIQEKWDAAGKVPRADMDRIEREMRRIETTVREAENKKWERSNPEVKARANSMVTQLESAIEGLEADLAKAESAGNARKVKELTEALKARRAWLDQARTGL